MRALPPATTTALPAATTWWAFGDNITPSWFRFAHARAVPCIPVAGDRRAITPAGINPSRCVRAWWFLTVRGGVAAVAYATIVLNNVLGWICLCDVAFVLFRRRKEVSVPSFLCHVGQTFYASSCHTTTMSHCPPPPHLTPPRRAGGRLAAGGSGLQPPTSNYRAVPATLGSRIAVVGLHCFFQPARLHSALPTPPPSFVVIRVPGRDYHSHSLIGVATRSPTFATPAEHHSRQYAHPGLPRRSPLTRRCVTHKRPPARPAFCYHYGDATMLVLRSFMP